MHKLLIVDDSNIVRRKIQRGHDKDKFELVGVAANGAEALERFKALKPDVVTMDLTMPQMDGIECIESLTDIDDAVKILVISALSDKSTGIQALQKGAQGFLCKPFTDQELSDALAELVSA